MDYFFGSQNNKFLVLLFLIGTFPAVNTLNGQSVGVNERGDSIIVFDDGSWRFFDAKVDQHLLGNTEEPIIEEQVIEEPIYVQSEVKKSKSKKSKKAPKVKKPKAKKNKSAKKKPAKNAKVASNKSKKNKSKKGNGKKDKAKKPKRSNVEDLAYENRLREEAIVRAELTATEAAIKSQTLEDIGFDLLLLEDDLKNAYTNTSTTDETIIQMEQKIQAKRKEEKIARASYEESRKLADFYNKLIDLPEDKRQKLLAKEYAKSGKLNDIAATAIETTEPDLVPELHEGQIGQSTKELKAEKKLKNSADLILNPPIPDCPKLDVGYNEFTGKRRIVMEAASFFSNTPKQMRMVLKDREYLEAFAHLEKVGNLTFLKLKIVIANSSAQNSYGLIEKGSRLTLKFIDGSNLPIFANGTVQGELNNLEKTVTYEVAYYLDKPSLKTLRKAEIDKIRLVWLTGFEDYDIYDVDFLAHRINCLQQ